MTDPVSPRPRTFVAQVVITIDDQTKFDHTAGTPGAPTHEALKDEMTSHLASVGASVRFSILYESHLP